MDTNENARTQVGLNLDEELYGLLKRAALRRRTSMSAIVRGLLVDARPTLREWAGDGEAAA